MTLVLSPSGLHVVKKFLLPFASSDETRPHMTGVGFSPGTVSYRSGRAEGATNVAFATDGHTLRILPLAMLLKRDPEAALPASGFALPLSFWTQTFASEKQAPTMATLVPYPSERDRLVPVRSTDVVGTGDDVVVYRVNRKALLARVKALSVVAKHETKKVRDAWLPQAKARFASQQKEHQAERVAYKNALAAWKRERKALKLPTRCGRDQPTRPQPPTMPLGPRVEDTIWLDGTRGRDLQMGVIVSGKPAHVSDVPVDDALLANEPMRFRQNEACEAFQANYLMRALSSFTEDELELGFSGQLSPMTLRPVPEGRSEWNLAMVMPVRL